MAHYFCTGTCKAVVNEDQYNQGLKVCGATGCTKEGHSFERHEDDSDGHLEETEVSEEE